MRYFQKKLKTRNHFKTKWGCIIPAGKAQIYVEQGASFTVGVMIYQPQALSTDPLVPLDISTWTDRGQIRKTVTDDAVQCELDFTVVDGPNGSAKVTATAAATLAIVIPAQKTAALNQGRLYRGPQIKTAGTTYIPPAGVTRIVVECQGGGGGQGKITNAAGSAGIGYGSGGGGAFALSASALGGSGTVGIITIVEYY